MIKLTTSLMQPSLQTQNNKKIIIGEGAYGCVHKPSIECKHIPEPHFNYNDYVSKIMKTSNAEKELKEFVTIGKIDKYDEYHLGTPKICKPKLDKNTVEDIKNCKNINVSDVIMNPNDYSLLVLKFGGPDLKILCLKYLETYLKTKKETKFDKFWLEVHHLLKGVRFFKLNGIVHYDLKPQNILFNTKTGKLKFIDFGLMRTKEQIISSSKKNKNKLGIFHWSYPFDTGFMNKDMYDEYYKSTPQTRTTFKKELADLIVINSEINTLDLPINKPRAYNILFSYLDPDGDNPDASTKYGYIDSFFDGFNQMIDTNPYNKVLDFITDSIDIFGFGFSMQYILNCFKRHNAVSLEDYTRLTGFFQKMYNFNPHNRIIDIDSLIDEYENILLEIGVLTRLKKSFRDHNVVNRLPIPKEIMEYSRKDESISKKLDPEIEEIAEKDALEIQVLCPKDKEFNHLIKRCVKKCKEGYKRDEKFKCRKTKKNTIFISRTRNRVKSRSKTRSRNRSRSNK